VVTTPAEVGGASRYFERGVATAIMCPILDLRGQPVGVIAAEYQRRAEQPDDAAVKARLYQAAQRVAGYLIPR
jgi:DNA-binding IclR family transcriptional regulator